MTDRYWHHHYVRRSSANNALLLLLRKDEPVELDTGPINPDSKIVVVNEQVGANLVKRFHKNPKAMRLMDRREFEELVAELFDGFGYHVELTQRTRDGGIDIVAVGHKDGIGTKYLIECKRPEPNKTLGVGLVRELLGVKTHEKATKAILATTTHFSADARLLERQHKWELELKDFNDIVDWIDQYIAIKFT